MTAEHIRPIPHTPKKIIFNNVAGETYGIFTKNGIELKDGSIVPPENITFFIDYVSRNGKKIRFEEQQCN